MSVTWWTILLLPTAVVVIGLLAAAVLSRKSSARRARPADSFWDGMQEALEAVEAYIPSDEDVALKVIDIVQEQMGKDSVWLDTPIDSLEPDSLDWVEMVMELEAEFEISIPDEMFEKVMALGTVRAFVMLAEAGIAARKGQHPASRQVFPFDNYDSTGNLRQELQGRSA